MKDFWHSIDERPSTKVDGYDICYVIVADAEYCCTAMYNPRSDAITPVSMDLKPVRRWHLWPLCNFDRWCYVSDFLNIQND